MLTKELEYYIECIVEGQKNALKNIYDILGGQVYAYAYTILKDRELAEDVSQEVFMKILNNAKSYQAGKNPKAWIMKIVHNEAIDVIRKRKEVLFSEPDDSSQMLDDSIDIEKSVIADENINTYINQLEETQQMIIKLHLLSELTFREIGSILNMSLGRVAWQYKSAIMKLKTNIKSREVLI